MIRIIKKQHYEFEYRIEIIFVSILTVVFWFITLALNTETDRTKKFYGKIETFYETKKYNIGDTSKYFAVVNFDEIKKQLTVEIDNKNFNSAYKGKVMKYDLIPYEYGKNNAIGLGLALFFSTIATIGLTLRTLFLLISLIVYITEIYKMRYINKKTWKHLKKIDPFSEEDWWD